VSGYTVPARGGGKVVEALTASLISFGLRDPRWLREGARALVLDGNATSFWATNSTVSHANSRLVAIIAIWSTKRTVPASDTRMAAASSSSPVIQAEADGRRGRPPRDGWLRARPLRRAVGRHVEPAVAFQRAQLRGR
jgi:hypothetical protein